MAKHNQTILLFNTLCFLILFTLLTYFSFDPPFPPPPEVENFAEIEGLGLLMSIISYIARVTTPPIVYTLGIGIAGAYVTIMQAIFLLWVVRSAQVYAGETYTAKIKLFHRIAFVPSIAVIAFGLVWWMYCYIPSLRTLNHVGYNFFSILPCAFLTTAKCVLFSSLALVGPKADYSPIVLWSGVGMLAYYLVLKLLSRVTS